MAEAAGFELETYLRDVFQGETLGEAFFGLLAECEADDADSARWRVLEHLERHVKQRMAAELEARGLDAVEDPAKADEGRAVAAALARMSSTERMKALANLLPPFIESYRASHDAAPEALKPLTGFVLAHEEALQEFTVRALAGDLARATHPIEALLQETGADKDVPVPEGVLLTALDDTYREDPYPVLRELRRRAPVHRDRTFGRFVLTRHDDVMRVLRDLDFWVDARKSSDDDYFRKLQVEQMERDPSMLGLDDPEHKRLRNLVSRSFTPRAVDTWQPIVEQVARELLDAVEGQEEFDLVEAIANPLPAIAIAKLLGVDESRQADFKAWSEASVLAGFNPFATDEEKAEAEKARQALDACFRAEIARRREQPSDDLIGKMVSANEDGDQLTEREIVTMGNLLLIAGNVTTSDLIGNGVKALCEHPDQLAKLRERPELLPNAIEEMLRFDPPVTQSGRIAPYDFEIGGVPVKQGQSFTTVLAAANRDPAVYPDPDVFDVEREDTHHQSFGGGAHLCLGAHLARLEAREAIGALIRRFPRLRAADRPHTFKRVPGFRGLSEFWVRVD